MMVDATLMVFRSLFSFFSFSLGSGLACLKGREPVTSWFLFPFAEASVVSRSSLSEDACAFSTFRKKEEVFEKEPEILKVVCHGLV